jgi:putative two-component system response regulator
MIKQMAEQPRLLWRIAEEVVQQENPERGGLQAVLQRLREVTQAQEESEERYRRIVQATGSFVFSVSMEDDVELATLFEPGTEHVTGYTAQDHVDDPMIWLTMVHPDDRVRVMQHIEALRQGKPMSVVEHRILHKDGPIRWLRNTSITRRDEDGTLIGYDGLITDITELKVAEQQRDELLKSLRELAISDAMTGLPNRRGFNDEMHRAWNMALRHQVSLGVLIIDVDHFKSVNDTHGHLVGDGVLREFADRIRPLLRESDVLCRYAGDELVAILPWTDRDMTRHVAERIRHAVEANSFEQCGMPLHITISIGGHAEMPREGHSPEVFINKADRALYRAKHLGRNRVSMSVQAKEVSVMEERAIPQIRSREAGLALVLDSDQERAEQAVAALATLQVEGVPVRNEAVARELMAREHGQVDLMLLDNAISEPQAFSLVDSLHQIDSLLVPIWLGPSYEESEALESIWERLPDAVGSPAWFACVRRSLEHRKLLLENRRYENHLEAMVHQKGRLLTRALHQAEKSFENTLEIMAQVIAAREQTTAEHCQRVARMAVILAEEIGVSEEEREQIRYGALLHDIGKIGIPDDILLKPGPLDADEWSVMQTHPRIGHRIVAGVPAFNTISDIVLSHQERYDGAGYPRGLRGEEICLGARIFAVVDAYDAMRSDRCYAGAVSTDEAIAELIREKHKQFDPMVVDAFIRRIEDMETSFNNQAALAG